MNEKALRTLEYTKIIERLTELAGSSIGKELCRNLKPSSNLAEIEAAQKQTSDALSRIYQRGSISFSGVQDVRGSLKRLEIGGSLSALELLRIAKLLETTSRVKSFGRLENSDREKDSLDDMFDGLQPLANLYNEIYRCILSEDEIADDASPALAKIRRSIRQTNDRVHTQLASLVNGSSRTYLQDAVITMRNGRYCVPVKSEYKGQVPGMIHDQSSTGSTLFIEPMAIVKLNNELRELELQEQKAIERFGFRHFEFVEKGPFRLNGSRLLLRGTHRHEDHAGVGAAMTEEQMRAEMTLMKEMGVNFIRLGHYQQSDIILSLCDELGILVWEEIPWCRGGLGGEQYQAQAKRMLTNMIHTHYNHPAVIIWGLGNENDWPNDFPEFDKGKIRSFMKELHELAHQSDDSRVTAIRRCDFCKDIVDVYSPSIWAGWYRGIFTDYKNASFHEMQQVKHFFHAEWGGDCHARRHAEDPFINLDKIEAGKGADERAGDASLYGGNARASTDGDWSESYMVRLIDWHLKEQETMDWLTGAAYWPFKDFSTPVRPENPVPYVNQKGVVERDLTPKETYYVFQSYWAKKPMIHIYGHTWPIRWGKPEEMKEILVYSNCPQVELIVNGVPQGIKKRNSQDYPAAGLHWNCKLQAGENTVIALSKGKAVVADTLRFVYETRTWGKPAQLQAKVTHCGGESSGDISMVEVQLTDAKGVPCLDAVNYIEFGLAGDGQLIENQGTSTGSRKVQAYNGRAAIRVDKRKGESVVSVRCDIPEVKTVFVRL